MRKRSSKRWFLMALLMLVSSVSAQGAVAAFSATDLLSGGLAASEELSLVSAASDAKEWEVNQADSSMSMKSLTISIAESQIYFNVVADEGWHLLAATFAYRDYENGVTAEQADEAAKTLGEAPATWAVTVAERTLSSNAPSGYLLVLGTTPKTALNDNLTGELYYALQFKNGNNPGETVWRRGKLSYRHCIKTPEFDSKTMLCAMPTADGHFTPTLKTTSTYGDRTIEMIAEEEIEDWETEWRRVLLERLAQVQDIIVNTEYYLKLFNQNMQTADKLLDGLAKLQGTVAGIEAIERNLPSYRQRIQDLRNYYNGLLGSQSSTEELEQLQKKNTELQQHNTDLQQSNAELSASNQELAEQNSRLEDENAALKQQVAELENALLEAEPPTDVVWQQRLVKLEAENAELAAKNAQLHEENAGLRIEIEKLRAENATLTVQASAPVTSAHLNEGSTAQPSSSGDESAVAESMLDNVTIPPVIEDQVMPDIAENHIADESTIAVPRLGGVSLRVWLMIALLALLIGVALLWVKRILTRKR